MAAEPKFRPVQGGIPRQYMVILCEVPEAKVEKIVLDLAKRHDAAIRTTWSKSVKGFWAIMPEETARAMSADPRVLYVQQNTRMELSGSQLTGNGKRPLDRNASPNESPMDGTPNGDFQFAADHPLWHLTRLSHRQRVEDDSLRKYEYSSTGAGVKIYVVDSGVLRFHQEFISDGPVPATTVDQGSVALHARVPEVAGSSQTKSNNGVGNGDDYPSSAPWQTETGAGQPCAPPINSTVTVETGAHYNPGIWFAYGLPSHGTAVASVAAGRNVGVAKGATIVPVKVIGCDQEEPATDAALVTAFEWIEQQVEASHTPAVVSMSTYRSVVACDRNWEGSRCNDAEAIDRVFIGPLEAAIEAVIDEGVPVVASANNNDRDACNEIPARLSWSGGIGGSNVNRGRVISVGGFAKGHDERWLDPTRADNPGSNWGPCVDIWAPAENINLAATTGWNVYRSENLSGTSYSAPMVAGIIARMFEEDVLLRADLTNATLRPGIAERVWHRLRDSATPFARPALLPARRASDINGWTLPSLLASSARTYATFYATQRRLAYIGAFTFSRQPSSTRITTAQHQLRVEAVGGADSYQWYRGESGDTSSPVSFGTADTLCVSKTTQSNCESLTANARYWARVTRDGMTADSAAATAVVDAPIITLSPRSQSVTPDGTAALTVFTLLPESSTAGYQWYRAAPTSQLISGATGQTYLVPGSEPTAGYFVRVTANGTPVDSEIALVRGCDLRSVSIARVEPLIGSVAQGEAVTLEAFPGVEDVRYVWYAGESGDTTTRLSAPNSNPKVFTFNPAATTKVWVRAIGACATVDSASISIPVCSRFSVEIDDAHIGVPPGGRRNIGVYVSPAPPSTSYTYTWFVQVENELHPRPALVGHFVNVPSTTATYRVLVDDGTCQILSPAITVVEFNNPSCTSAIDYQSVPSNVTLDPGELLDVVRINDALGTARWRIGKDSRTPHEALCVNCEYPPIEVTESGDYWLRVDRCIGGGLLGAEDTPIIRVTLTTDLPCDQPRERVVSASPIGTVTPGTQVTLSVPNDNDGVAFQWFAGSDHTTATSIGSGDSIQVSPLVATTYWVRMTRTCASGTATRDTTNFTVHVTSNSCDPAIFIAPLSAGKTIPAEGVSATLTASVTAGGLGPYTYQWQIQEPNGSWTDDSTGSSFSWTITGPPAAQRLIGMQIRVRAIVTNKCDTQTSDVITLTFSDAAPQKIFAYNSVETIYSPANPARLYVVMDPENNALGEHTYEYQWYHDDGTPDGDPVGGNSPELHATTSGMDSYWVVVTGWHQRGPDANGNIATYTEKTVSPRMYVKLYGTCAAAPVSVRQNITRLESGPTPLVTFLATSHTHHVTYQWYLGISGDTRHPIDADDDHPDRLTVSTGSLHPYWVRATAECGSHADSATLIITRNDCSPVVFDQHIASVDVAWGDDALLSVDALAVDRPSYTWYEDGNDNDPIGTGRQLTLHDVTASGRYWVRVRNLDCSNSTASYVATVRVASHTGITPPQWPAQVWAAQNQTATLSATSAGASGYQWYRGEVGDDSQPISGATLPTYTTAPVTADAKFWVRVFGNGGSLDSPTIALKVCIPPQLPPHPHTEQNIIAGQWIVFGYPVTGTNISYQWYRGERLDESSPIGRNIDRLQVHPNVTTKYWVKVTSHCGPAGNDLVSAASPTFTASVCPATGAVSATPASVMPGSTSTLSIVPAGGDATYKWYYGSAGDRSQPVPNGESHTVTTPAITANKTFWCEVKSGNCSRFSEEVTVSLCSEPTVYWVTGNRSIASGDWITLTANASATSGEALVTYYAGPAGNVAASTVIGGPTNFPINRSFDETTQVWARATLANCYADTNNITVTVCIPRITQQPQPASITASESATLSVATDITPASYTWYAGETGDTSSPVPGGTMASISVSPTVDTKYWVRVRGCGASKEDSVAVLVSVCTPPTINSHIQSQWIEQGTTRTLFVGASGTNLVHRWYRGAVGTTTSLISTAATVNVTPSETTSYWARVSNGCGSQDTAAVVISVCAPPAITTQPASRSIFTGHTTTLTVSATQSTATPMTYQWFTGTTSGNGTPISGATSASFTTPALTGDTHYWVRVTAGTCATDSQVAIVSMCSYPEVIEGPADRDIALGGTARLQTTISPVPTGYTWYRGAQGVRTHPIGNINHVDVSPTVTTQYWAEITHGDCTAKTRTITVFVSIPTITQQPVNTQVNPNTRATLTVTADTIGVTYQWYSGTAPSGTPIAGETNATFLAPLMPAGSTASYWVKVTGSRGHVVNSNTAIVTVCQPAAITAQPQSHSIQRGQQVTLSVAATGTNLTYRWYNGVSGNTSSPAASTSSTLSVSPTIPKQYWVRVTSDCGTVDSTTANVAVCVTPVVDTQPQSISIFSGTTATLSVAASQETGLPITYQWYAGTTPGSGGTLIPGATSPSYTTPALTSEANYWVKVTSGVCQTASNVATVSICSYQPVLNAPDDRDITIGQTVRLSIVLSPPPIAVTWYRGVQGDRSHPISNISYADVSPAVTTQYWGEYTHGTCVSKTRTVTVFASIPTITQQPASTQVTSTTRATLTVAANTAGVTYQWYSGTAPGGTPLAGETGASYQAPLMPVGATASYWVKVTGSRGHVVNSNTAIVTVCNPATITTEPVSRSIQRGQQVVLTVAATGTNITYRWYNGVSGNTNSPTSSTTSTLTVSPTMPKQYWVRVTSSCGTDDSITANVDVCVEPVITQQPASHSVFSGSSATLTVAATQETGLPITYQWYTGTESGVGSPIAGATGATYVTPALSTTSFYWVKVKSGVCETLSDIATVAMCYYPTVLNAPGDRTIQAGNSTQLKITLSPSPDSARWYRGVQGDRTNLISTQIYPYVSPTVTTQYWGELVKDGCTSMTRTVTVTVN